MTDQKNEQKQGRLCDYCNQSTALLYCRADSANLCFSCDREVHSANQLFSKHSRSLLCDSCDESSASIFCETDQSVFCSNCDWENHKLSSSSLHKRSPIEGFTGCPSVSELVGFIGIDDLGYKSSFSSQEKVSCRDDGDDDGLLGLLSWETPVISLFDGLIAPNDFDHGFKPTDVPSLPKNRNASCGQHKDEILQQLRELAKSEPTLSFGKTDVEASVGFQSFIPDSDNLHPGGVHTSCKNDTDPILFPAYECFTDDFEMANQVFLPSAHLSGYTEESAVVPDNHLDSSRTKQVNDGPENQLQHQLDAGTISRPSKVAVFELNSEERETAISRYKEKRKTRRFDKHIRYESRKVRAESRTRIKGRFAKVEN